MKAGRRGGFTLIEVLVALVVAVAALTLLAQGFSTGGRASAASQISTRAALLSQRIITDLETGELAANQAHSGAFDDDPDFTWDLASEPEDLGLLRVTVTIKWEERNQKRSFVLVRLLREKEPTQ